MRSTPLQPAPNALAAVALGSNRGDRAATLRSALAALGALPRTRLLAGATPIETAPVGPVPQGPYLNSAALLETALTPRELLDALLEIERAHGRRRTRERRWGPRTLDLDLLTHGQAVIDEPGLTLPHPRLRERRFVLEPLAEIAPDLPIAPDGRTPVQLLALLRGEPSGGASATTGACRA